MKSPSQKLACSETTPRYAGLARQPALFRVSQGKGNADRNWPDDSCSVHIEHIHEKYFHPRTTVKEIIIRKAYIGCKMGYCIHVTFQYCVTMYVLPARIKSSEYSYIFHSRYCRIQLSFILIVSFWVYEALSTRKCS